MSVVGWVGRGDAISLPGSQQQVLASPHKSWRAGTCWSLGHPPSPAPLPNWNPMPAALADCLLLSHGLLDGRTSVHGEAEDGGATSSCPQLLGSHTQLLAGSSRQRGKAGAPCAPSGLCWTPLFFREFVGTWAAGGLRCHGFAG